MVCMYGFVCYTNHIGVLSTLTANQITDSKCVSCKQIFLRLVGQWPFLYRYKLLPRILNTVLLQRTNLTFVSLLLSNCKLVISNFEEKHEIYTRNLKGQNSARSVSSAAQLNVLLRLLNKQHLVDALSRPDYRS